VTTVILMTLFFLSKDERSKFQTQKGLIFGLVWDDGGFGAGVNFHRWSNF
jgi:hypothetical protein